MKIGFWTAAPTLDLQQRIRNSVRKKLSRVSGFSISIIRKPALKFARPQQSANQPLTRVAAAKQPQLFDRAKLRYNDELVHESYTLNGRLGYLHEHILQYPWDTMEIATAKLQRYSTLMAQRYAAANGRASLPKLVCSPVAMFLKVFVVQQGFRDGRYGLILASLYAYYTFLKYAKLWELQRKETKAPNS